MGWKGGREGWWLHPAPRTTDSSSCVTNEGGKGFGAPDVFDNAYYSFLLRRPWLDSKDNMASMIGLPSDHVLPDDPECLPVIQV